MGPKSTLKCSILIRCDKAKIPGAKISIKILRKKILTSIELNNDSASSVVRIFFKISYVVNNQKNPSNEVIPFTNSKYF